MFSFFPRVGLNNIKSYYKYRKIIISYISMIYLLFPFSTKLSDIKIFFFCLCILSIFMLINNISSIIFSESTINNITLIIRITYGIFLALLIRDMLPFEIENIIAMTNVIILALLFLLLWIINIYLLSIQTKYVNTFKTNLVFFKVYNPFFLFLLRTKVKYDIILLLFVSFLSVFIDKNYNEPFAFVVTMLTSLYIIYYEYLKMQKNKINIFYNVINLKKLRMDTIFSLSEFSIVFLIIAIILGILSNSLLTHFMYYLLTIISFSLSNSIIPINIEKRINKKIIILKDLVKSILLTVLLLSCFIFIFIKFI